ncbi:glutamate-5-semialdehyde dehydrogenase [Dolichospermum circinale]|jgi:glutamate-5-semialdehyde dehydrogenase|uniref:glutamate-5-semialdehyde dehydrogenase n=1 Tax=Dolichospermum circinale TaxID=109265 RepID=UPI0004094DD1|nr:glutamate-5-semialdehyde dehydrogenase [Dolichospermum circinale]MCE2718694.1 glutamate-5-semialdehyde dehydrogenase [Anabaena sp. 49628_E55]MDB9476946.1 glutamate-5-semialdehyde dehydrogenase [Dolichospermum circinale CS-537/11]MDB9479405.1 glutamate-5-semialdehyde dehydrogenase [Dolichospermum circinale CS-537/03]MDB9490554.1 glutamate-5-semialdehyde dehydrogenase [Dolichospermum circinale CS-534/05]
MTNLNIASPLRAIAQQTRQAASKLALLSSEGKNQAIEAIAQGLESAKDDILQANLADCQAAIAAGIAKPLYKRLQLDEHKLRDAIAGVRDVGKLDDPIGQVQINREIDSGLILKRITCPLGVLGIIFEARPEAAIQIVSLAIKSGNGVILKGGKEALNSCEAIVKAIKQGLSQTGVNADAVQLLTTREEILELLQLDKYVDLIIPRGSNAFVKFVQDNTRIPVLGHADGICHIYVDEKADIDKAISITVDSKIQYPAACNAIETLLIHSSIAEEFLPHIAAALAAENVELRGDERSLKILPNIAAATEEDWRTEYSDLILAIKIVDSLTEAISHINNYGSRHTEAIITEDITAAETFQGLVNAAGVYHNCSTRFADGFRYGFGAEVGISTQQMPPRGPVGLEGLITYKYQMSGNGHIVKTYTGANAKSFSHRDL